MTLTLTNTYYLQESNPTFTAELLKEYERQIDASPQTIKTYMACIKRFVAWLEERQINTVEYDTIVIYKNHLGETMRAKAINTHLSAIKDLFKFIERKGGRNVAKSVKKEKVSNDFVYIQSLDVLCNPSCLQIKQWLIGCKFHITLRVRNHNHTE